ncbi:integrase [Streptomyces sp. NPDC005322]|uniref:integrase n=1 Tax=Streptomyces sp. NPDC005322 TaxID=3157032 RepID=UPI0033A2CFDF
MDPDGAGWGLRVVPTLGHLRIPTVSNGVIDRALYGRIADGHGRSSVKNTIAPLARVIQQAVRDGIIDINPAKVTGWQKTYKQAEDELDDPRSLALPTWEALETLADALVTRSADQFPGWGNLIRFAAGTAARIGEVSGVRAGDIDRRAWTWDVCRQTIPGPGGLIDKGTKGKRRRTVPLTPEIRDLVGRTPRRGRPRPRSAATLRYDPYRTIATASRVPTVRIAL